MDPNMTRFANSFCWLTYSPAKFLFDAKIYCSTINEN